MGEFYSSSGSEHEPDSLCLQDMVHAFMHLSQEEEAEAASCSQVVGGSFRRNGFMGAGPREDCLAAWHEKAHILKGVVADCEEAERDVLGHVSSFVETKGGQQPRSALQRSVMNHLRSRGYDAAICKSQPGHATRLPPGKYEYMDVVKNTTRLLVDIDFRAQFEIAKPSEEYAALLELLPPVYVGKSDRLLQIVKIMADSAKASLKAKRMHVPPWRTYTYMLSKWLGSYKRTTNSCSSTDVQSYACTPCHAREERKLTSRLASLLMEAGIKSMSRTEPSGPCQDELQPELIVA